MGPWRLWHIDPLSIVHLPWGPQGFDTLTHWALRIYHGALKALTHWPTEHCASTTGPSRLWHIDPLSIVHLPWGPQGFDTLTHWALCIYHGALKALTHWPTEHCASTMGPSRLWHINPLSIVHLPWGPQGLDTLTHWALRIYHGALKALTHCPTEHCASTMGPSRLWHIDPLSIAHLPWGPQGFDTLTHWALRIYHGALKALTHWPTEHCASTMGPSRLWHIDPLCIAHLPWGPESFDTLTHWALRIYHGALKAMTHCPTVHCASTMGPSRLRHIAPLSIAHLPWGPEGFDTLTHWALRIYHGALKALTHWPTVHCASTMGSWKLWHIDPLSIAHLPWGPEGFDTLTHWALRIYHGALKASTHCPTVHCASTMGPWKLWHIDPLSIAHLPWGPQGFDTLTHKALRIYHGALKALTHWPTEHCASTMGPSRLWHIDPQSIAHLPWGPEGFDTLTHWALCIYHGALKALTHWPTEHCASTMGPWRLWHIDPLSIVHLPWGPEGFDTLTHWALRIYHGALKALTHWPTEHCASTMGPSRLWHIDPQSIAHLPWGPEGFDTLTHWALCIYHGALKALTHWPTKHCASTMGPWRLWHIDPLSIVHLPWGPEGFDTLTHWALRIYHGALKALTHWPTEHCASTVGPWRLWHIDPLSIAHLPWGPEGFDTLTHWALCIYRGALKALTHWPTEHCASTMGPWRLWHIDPLSIVHLPWGPEGFDTLTHWALRIYHGALKALTHWPTEHCASTVGPWRLWHIDPLSIAHLPWGPEGFDTLTHWALRIYHGALKALTHWPTEHCASTMGPSRLWHIDPLSIAHLPWGLKALTHWPAEYCASTMGPWRLWHIDPLSIAHLPWGPQGFDTLTHWALRIYHGALKALTHWPTEHCASTMGPSRLWHIDPLSIAHLPWGPQGFDTLTHWALRIYHGALKALTHWPTEHCASTMGPRRLWHIDPLSIAHLP